MNRRLYVCVYSGKLMGLNFKTNKQTKILWESETNQVKVVAKIITGEDERVHCTHKISWRVKCKKCNWLKAKTNILNAGSRTAFMRWE